MNDGEPVRKILGKEVSFGGGNNQRIEEYRFERHFCGTIDGLIGTSLREVRKEMENNSQISNVVHCLC